MKPNTSLAITLLGISLALHAISPLDAWSKRLARGIAIVPLLIGIATALEHLGIQIPGLDTLVAASPGGVFPSGRASPVTATMIACLGLGLFAKGMSRAWHRVVLGCVVVTLSLSVTALSGYLFSADLMYLSIGFETVAVHTAAGCLLLALGIPLCRPSEPPISLLIEQSAAGAVLRSGLPACAVALILLRVGTAMLFRAGLITAPIGLGLGLVGEFLITIGAFAYAGRVARGLEQRILESYEQVKASEQRFRLLSDAAPVLIWVSDRTGKCVFFNRGWLDFTGRTHEQECGDGWAEGVHGDDLEACLATYLSHFHARKPFKMEYRLRRFDGEYRWLIDAGVPYNDASGSFAGFIGSCIDITESRRAMERHRLLMNELDHRVKNNLASVVAVADMTFEANHDPAAFRRSFQGRLMAMARAHSALAAGRWTGLGLRTLVEIVLEPLGPGLNDSFRVEGPPVHIPQQAVSPLAMVLHELGTNAQKHGALSRSGGQVRIEWNLDGHDRSSSWLAINWTESGGPSPPPQPAPGLGTTILRGLVESELGGELLVKFVSTGLECIIAFKTDAWELDRLSNDVRGIASAEFVAAGTEESKV